MATVTDEYTNYYLQAAAVRHDERRRGLGLEAPTRRRAHDTFVTIPPIPLQLS